jgi:hypothetical protein
MMNRSSLRSVVVLSFGWALAACALAPPTTEDEREPEVPVASVDTSVRVATTSEPPGVGQPRSCWQWRCIAPVGQPPENCIYRLVWVCGSRSPTSP